MNKNKEPLNTQYGLYNVRFYCVHIAVPLLSSVYVAGLYTPARRILTCTQTGEAWPKTFGDWMTGYKVVQVQQAIRSFSRIAPMSFVQERATSLADEGKIDVSRETAKAVATVAYGGTVDTLTAAFEAMTAMQQTQGTPQSAEKLRFRDLYAKLGAFRTIQRLYRGVPIVAGRQFAFWTTVVTAKNTIEKENLLKNVISEDNVLAHKTATTVLTTLAGTCSSVTLAPFLRSYTLMNHYTSPQTFFNAFKHTLKTGPYKGVGGLTLLTAVSVSGTVGGLAASEYLEDFFEARRCNR